MTATPWALGFLLRHAADELQRALAGVLDLVALVRGHPQDVAGFNRMFALGSHHEPPAFQDVHLLLIPVIVERRGGAGLDLKDAHREVLRAALLVDHPPDFHARHIFRLLGSDIFWAKDFHWLSLPPNNFRRHRGRSLRSSQCQRGGGELFSRSEAIVYSRPQGGFPCETASPCRDSGVGGGGEYLPDEGEGPAAGRARVSELAG